VLAHDMLPQRTHLGHELLFEPSHERGLSYCDGMRGLGRDEEGD